MDAPKVQGEDTGTQWKTLLAIVQGCHVLFYVNGALGGCGASSKNDHRMFVERFSASFAASILKVACGNQSTFLESAGNCFCDNSPRCGSAAQGPQAAIMFECRGNQAARMSIESVSGYFPKG